MITLTIKAPENVIVAQGVIIEIYKDIKPKSGDLYIMVDPALDQSHSKIEIKVMTDLTERSMTIFPSCKFYKVKSIIGMIQNQYIK